jgi:hypothetical protein
MFGINWPAMPFRAGRDVAGQFRQTAYLRVGEINAVGHPHGR